MDEQNDAGYLEDFDNDQTPIGNSVSRLGVGLDRLGAGRNLREKRGGFYCPSRS